MQQTKPNGRTRDSGLRLPSEIHVQVRRLAFEQGVSLNAWIVQAVRERLEIETERAQNAADPDLPKGALIAWGEDGELHDITLGDQVLFARDARGDRCRVRVVRLEEEGG